ncbi:MAG: TetR/AcrR family transcriptional repressor of nem operon [Oleiphilaceae bacterium]|jgi:TetR/AcrR family transcriptional repressor of nem operon
MARKIEFDKNQALQKAMRLFWEKGYEATSIEDLVQAMEINRFSIYNTFGDKKALFLKALKYYRDSVLAKLIAPLKEDLPAKICLDNYLTNMSKQLSSSSGSLGCFIQRTGQSYIAGEQEVGVLLLSMLDELRSALVNIVKRSIEENGLKGLHQYEIIVDFILSQIQGLIVLRRSGKKRVAFDSQIDVLKSTVFSW